MYNFEGGYDKFIFMFVEFDIYQGIMQIFEIVDFDGSLINVLLFNFNDIYYIFSIENVGLKGYF